MRIEGKCDTIQIHTNITLLTVYHSQIHLEVCQWSSVSPSGGGQEVHCERVDVLISKWITDYHQTDSWRVVVRCRMEAVLAVASPSATQHCKHNTILAHSDRGRMRSGAHLAHCEADSPSFFQLQNGRERLKRELVPPVRESRLPFQSHLKSGESRE